VAKAISADQLFLAEPNSTVETGPYDACLQRVESFIARNKRWALSRRLGHLTDTTISRAGEKIASRICINGLGGYRWGKEPPNVRIDP
jgi:hypothetical protein